ncbi:MAG: hypothetical protein IJ087_15670 [Eggerthellaceae bacterium]|nr:hypothetical protein [Eggerthellaceae bacterium]
MKFESPKARDVVVDEGASFTFAGALALASSALDAAHVEASSFDVESSFALSATPLGNGMTGTLACDVASPAGENAEGTTFARGATSAQAALFADAYREMQPVAAADGVAWSAASNSVVAFQVGDAVVARYANPSTIDLAEPTAAAKRADDERQTYEIAGWSLVPDENATSGYESADATITPAGSATYYAVYETGLASVPVRFANVFDLSGNLQPDVAFTAEYGSSVGEAARAAGASIPAPADYADASTGLEYRFAGWFPYSASISSGALLYDPVQVEDLDITLSVSGVSATGLVLRAVYVAVEPGCHLVTFKVDGYTSYCVVGDGARPVYTAANGTNTSYVSPAKQVSEAGKTFTFNCWFVDADGDGSRSEGEPSYDSVLPKAYGDVSYTADWTWVWSDVTLTFYTKYYDEATDSLVLNGMRIINTTYETQTQAAADSVARIGSSFGYGGKVYTLDGWSIRKSDTQAVYDAGRPLPSVTNDDRFLAANYSKSFYGVYSVADHKLNVAFFDSDGARELGRAEGLVAIRTSVDAAFKATGAAEPQASKGSQVFLGWALEPGADKAMSSSATMLESLVTYEDSSLNLYAVYGSNPTHTVRLRDAQGDQVLYRVSVAQGATVSSALRKAGVDVEMTAPVGKYFAGWRTAAGQFFSLDAPVSGSADVYASYRSIKVDTAKAEGVTAAVSLSKELNSTLGIGDELNEVRLTVEQRSSADSPLRSQMAADGYTLLKGYTVKLAATYASGESVVQEGDIGSVQLKIPVESKYADAKVHVYWLGLEKGSEKVMRSGEKQLEDGERISVNIGNTEVGDEDEGGNVAVIYREGGAGTGGLVDGATGGLSETGTSSLSSGLSSSGLSSSLSGASSGLAASSATGPAAGAAALSASGDTTGADGGASPDALAAGEEGSMTGNWDGDAIVLVALAAVALAALLDGIWRLAVVRPRREEAQAEMPVMLDQYAKGLRF